MKNYHTAARLFTVLMLSTVLPLCSCEQQENTLSDGKDVLTIHATLDGELDVNTRSYSGDVSIVDKGFTIAGYLLKGQYAPETMTIAPNVFDKSTGYQAVSKLSATNAKFKIPLPLIGLGTEDEPTYLSVLAWTQGDTDTGYGITGQTGNSSVGMPYLNINLQSPERKQGDIAAAQKIDHLNDYVITAIDLDFKHILSKMSFVVKNSTGTSISVKDVKLAVAGDALYSKAKYTFNGSDSIGIYSNYSTYYPQKEYTPTGWTTTPTLTDAQTTTLGELLLIPQKAPAGFITVKLTYSVNSGASITRILPLKARDLQAGKNYIYTLDVNADAINVINVSVGGWKEAPTNALPMVPGECGDVMLLLEGKDEPYQHTDGKLYWLDRSGYNRHVLLGAGYKSYDNSKHGYVFSGTAPGGTIPALGTMSNLTVDLVAEHTSGGPYLNYSEVFQFSDYLLQLPHSGTSVDWKHPGGYARWEAPSLTDIDKLSHWTCISNYNGNQGLAYKNAILVAKRSGSVTSSNVSSGTLSKSYAGCILYLKVTTKAFTQQQAIDNNQKIVERFKIVDNTYLPPIAAGLIACFDARTGFSGSGYYGSWTDIAYNKVISSSFSSTGSINKNSSEKAIVFTGPVYPNQGPKMVGTLNLGSYNELTFEMVQQSISPHLNFMLEIQDGNGQSCIFIRPNTGGNRGIELTSKINDKFYYECGDPTIEKGSFVYVLSGKDGTLKVYHNGSLMTSGTFPATSTTLDLRKFTIGNAKEGYHAFTGNLHALRIYNRPLSSDEIRTNYNSDKQNFSIP